MNYSILSRIFIFLLLVITFSGCGGSSKNQQTGITGIAQKGDFLKDSQISFARFSNSGASSTERLDSLILNNRGEYAVNLAWSDWTKITVTGIFYNEFLGKDSTSTLSLNSITDIRDSLSGVNVNFFTHLVAARTEHLVNNGNSVSIANKQALSELKLLLGLTTNNLNTLDLTKNSHPDNAILLLFSSGFLATNTQQKFATSLDNLTMDFADNGLFDGVSASVFQEIANYSGKRNVFFPIYNNLIAKGYANPPNQSMLGELPNWVNKNPIVNIEGAESGKTISLGESVTLNGSASDSDGSIASWAWKKGATVLSSGTGSTISPYTLSNLSIGSHTYTLEVIDNEGASDTDQVVITVVSGSGNIPPTANAGSNKTIVELQSLQLQGQGTDTDGSISSYSWHEGSVNLSSTQTLNLKVLSPGTHNLTLTVTDNSGATGSDNVTINVMALKVDLSNQAICRSKYGFNIQVIYSLSGNKTGSGNSELNLWSEPGCTGTRSDPSSIGYSRYAPATYVITSVSATGTSGAMAITSQGKSSTRSITINSDGRVTTIN